MKKFQRGFVIGLIIGSILTLIATGHLIMMVYTSEARAISIVILFFLFSFTQMSTLILAVTAEKNKLVNSFPRGCFAGIGFIEAMIIFGLYGFRL
jgi:hypothetical protein